LGGVRGRRVGRARRRAVGHVFFRALLTPSVLPRLFVALRALYSASLSLGTSRSFAVLRPLALLPAPAPAARTSPLRRGVTPQPPPPPPLLPSRRGLPPRPPSPATDSRPLAAQGTYWCRRHQATNYARCLSLFLTIHAFDLLGVFGRWRRVCRPVRPRRAWRRLRRPHQRRSD